MFTHGLYDRKWVYPSLFFLFLLFLLWHFGLARGAQGMDAPRRGHGESDFIAAADRFNERLTDESSGYDRYAGKDDRSQDLYSWSVVPEHIQGYYTGSSDDTRRSRDTYNDHSYQQARRQMDARRVRDTELYRDQRRDLENRLSYSNRTSPEYTRLERELNDLDRRHAERERNYERDFRNMDADYSLTRW